MKSDDPFASIADRCHISSSQEEYLSRCRFAGEPEDGSLSDDESGDIPVASTAIMIVSPPDSPEENEHDVRIPLDNDVFLTPPEESTLPTSQEQQQQTVAVDNRDDPTVEEVADNGNFAAVDGSCTDDSRRVDLGRDTDLGFSAGMELTEEIKIDSGSQSSLALNQVNVNKVIHCEPRNVTIKERELDASDGLFEPLAKKMKIVDKNLGLATPEPCSGAEAAKTLKRVAKSLEKLKSSPKNSNKNVVLETSRVASGTNTGNLGKTAKKLSFEGISLPNALNSLQNHQIEKQVNGGDRESQGDSSAKRKLQFYSEALESNLEDNNVVSAFNKNTVESESEEIEEDEVNRLCNTSETSSETNSHGRQKNREAKSIDDIDKFRYVGPTGASSSEKHKYFRAKRALPVSLWGNNGNAGGKVVPNDVLCTSNYKVVTLLDVLRKLAEEYTYDPGLANLGVLEAAKRRGMTFP